MKAIYEIQVPAFVSFVFEYEMSDLIEYYGEEREFTREEIEEFVKDRCSDYETEIDCTERRHYFDKNGTLNVSDEFLGCSVSIDEEGV